MQVTQADSNNSRRVGVEEELIKFRPSPNFKNMKKFLKNRSDYTETTSLCNYKISPEPSPQPKVEKKVEVKPVVVQPPLPPYPPPPDSPPNLNIVIKQEKEDVDVPNGEESSENYNSEPQQVTEPERSGGENRPKKTMCKEFIRGDCKRSVCRYSHELDLSQLRGVFTFCWNYQNARCTFPYCKFVHASIFEEAEFYRTGLLPPHARAHLKKPPPPPPPPVEENQVIPPSNFVNPPPPLHPSMDKPSIPFISCIPGANIEQRSVDDFTNSLRQSSKSSLKREWNEIDEFSSSPRDIEPIEHLAKKCKKCEIMEFRYQYSKEKMEKMIQNSEELKKKMTILNKKSTKLSFVLTTLMKPANNNAKTSVTGVTNVGSSDKEKTILEQLSGLINTNNRVSSVANDDNVKNIFGGNINLSNLAKLLYSTGEQTLSPDTSRET